MPREPEQPALPSLTDKIAFLKQPGNYPEPTSRVDAVETHMSWVFLTDAFAYKLKKPVRYDYLDFSSPEARRLDCEEELRLNRRLAESVYLTVVPLLLDPDGHLSLGRQGQPVDWLVKMRRLPAERMLDTLIRRRAVTEEEVRGLARRLSAFYAGAVPEPVSAEQYRQRLTGQIAANLRELGRREFGLPADRLARIAQAQSAFVQQQAAILDGRVARGCIVEGHGDLRPEHVCLLAEPVVIDCLEFKRDFRIADPLDELGHLLLECEQLGMPEIRPWLLMAYAEASGDHWPAPLLYFYQSCRASLRAKLAIWHLRDDGRHPPEKWIRTTHEYLDLAERYIEQAGAQGCD
jgi:aminoglycoside phosphotransferase family enzyme